MNAVRSGVKTVSIGWTRPVLVAFRETCIVWSEAEAMGALANPATTQIRRQTLNVGEGKLNGTLAQARCSLEELKSVPEATRG